MSTEIAAPRHRVWPLLVDWENLGLWMTEASGFKVTSAHREGVGVTAVATIRIAGFHTTDAVQVIGWEFEKLLVIKHLGWVTGTGRMALDGDNTTVIRWTETLDPPWGLFGALGMRLLAPGIRRVFRRDLGLLKGLAEVSL
ncbi:MAG: SRPBCC family protein [Actinomycetota bacterium]